MLSRSAIRNMVIGIGFNPLIPRGVRAVDLPFRRPKTAIVIVLVMFIVMAIPAAGVVSNAVETMQSMDTLFELSTVLFLGGWLLGWGSGLLLLLAMLLILTSGGETLLPMPGRLEIRLGLRMLYVRVLMDPGKISNLHHSIPQSQSGKSWRGPHLAFDYDGSRMETGSDLSETRSSELAGLLRALPAASIWPPQAAPPAFADDGRAEHPGVPEEQQTATGSSSPALVALVAANLLPVAGILLAGWELGELMVLYWAESGIIGAYQVLKIAHVQGWLVLLSGAFFIGHFGAFMAVHLLFVFELFVTQDHSSSASLTQVADYFIRLWPALLALVTSHGISYLHHFIGRQEYRHASTRTLMSAPYVRVVIMHVTLIIGGGITLLLGNALPALLLLVAMKLTADLHAHRNQHAQTQHKPANRRNLAGETVNRTSQPDGP